MKQLTCEICEGTRFVKVDGNFVCQDCGCEYSVEEAKKMMSDSVVDVRGTVKIDRSEELDNLYMIARRAKNDGNAESAAKYYDMILIKDPTSWEATFYVVYFKAMECKIAGIQAAGISVTNCIDTVLDLIVNNVEDQEEQVSAYTEVATKVLTIARLLFNAAQNHYNQIDSRIRRNYLQEWINNAFAAMQCAYTLGNCLDECFGANSSANSLTVSAWKQGIVWHQTLIGHLDSKDLNRNTIKLYAEKIKKYDATYTLPQEPQLNTGCYIATSVYGSYDCPEVWTLRRFRDDTLGATWYGRAFIRFYYALSPTLVKWFGKTRWFKNFWQKKLDRMVKDLQAKGVESTPYSDKDWR